jgi:NADP-dependent 3-hydroxy acid dehydrogenase YdfG
MSHTLLITGASSGIGLELSLAALKAGHKVIGTGRNIEKSRESNPQFEAAGGEWAPLDVTKPDVPQFIEKLVREKNIDIVVNNAGYSVLGAFEFFR